MHTAETWEEGMFGEINPDSSNQNKKEGRKEEMDLCQGRRGTEGGRLGDKSSSE